MIEAVHENHVRVRCAHCDEVRDHAFADLHVAVLSTTSATVALPACTCGSVEYLIRTPRPAPADLASASHRHHLLVDHLHAELVRAKRVARTNHDATEVCPPVPEEVLAHWFPPGLSLRANGTEEANTP
jgi:hypothetical protein